MDQIRLCDIGRKNIGPAVRSVDRVLENSSEVGEKADYPVYQPCNKETDGVHVYSHWLSPLPFVLNSTSHHDYLSTHKKISVRSFLSSLLTPSPHFRSYLNISTIGPTAFRDERAVPAILEFLEGARVGEMLGRILLTGGPDLEEEELECVSLQV